MEWYDDDAKEWVTLGARALATSAIYYETQINSRILQGERSRAGVLRGEETSEGGMAIDIEAQWVRIKGQTRVAELGRRPGHVVVPVELRAEVSAHRF